MENKQKVASIFTEEMKKDRFLLSFLINELINQVPKENVITGISTEVIDSKNVIVIKSTKE